jgi:hypothetical protein
MTEMQAPHPAAVSEAFGHLRRRLAAPALDDVRPLLFRLRFPDDRRAFAEWMSPVDDQFEIFDTLLFQLRDLMRTRHPDRALVAADVDALVQQQVAGVDPVEYGVWAFYPWSRRLVHVLDEAEFVELRTNRNRYKITADEQATLSQKHVGIVGLSVGHAVALTLVLERSCGGLRLADFDTLDLSNLNRIRTGIHGLGLAKTWVTAREIAELDPYFPVSLFREGISAGNADAFFLDDGSLDLVVDECDSLDIKVILRDRARRYGVPVVMQTSDRGMLDVERYEREPRRPPFHGLAGDLDATALAGLTTEQKTPYVLRIVGVETMSRRLRASMLEINQSLATWPQLGSEVTYGGGAAADTVRRILLGEDVRSGRRFLASSGRGRRHTPPRSEQHRRDGEPRRRCEDALMRHLVAQAALSPSGGNSQPWLWRAGDNRLDLFVDPSRHSGLIDFECAGSYVALGAAVESLVLGAHAAGREVRLHWHLEDVPHERVASIELQPGPGADVESHDWDALHVQMPRRHTTRRFSNRLPFPRHASTALSEAVGSIAGCDVQWIDDVVGLEEIGRIIGAGDRLRLLYPPTHGELFAELRWTPQEAARTADGIDVATLGLSESDYAGLTVCRDRATLELVRQWGGGKNLEKIARTQIARASAVGLITTQSARPIDYGLGGRAVQRMWLAATRDRIAIHPMSTLPFFFARLIRGGGEGFDRATIDGLKPLRERYEELFKLSPITGEVLLFAVGFASGDMPRSLRRPLDDILYAADTPSCG